MRSGATRQTDFYTTLFFYILFERREIPAVFFIFTQIRNMRFEIRENYEISKEKTMLLFHLTWKKYYRKVLLNTAIAIWLLVLGTYLLVTRNQICLVFLPLGIFIAVITLQHFYLYRKTKRNTLNLVSKFKGELGDNDLIVMEFTDERYSSESKLGDVSLSWKIFRGYMFENDTLVLLTNLGVTFLVSEKEIGPENFNSLHNFVNGKLRKLKHFAAI